jgi:nucleoside-diphosphate-sugar epimerase
MPTRNAPSARVRASAAAAKKWRDSQPAWTACHASLVDEVFVLGTGYTGTAVVKLARARGQRVLATVRQPDAIAPLKELGAEPILLQELDATLGKYVTPQTHVVITFPPDGSTDERIAKGLTGAGSITYVSTTGVYGDQRGHVDDGTPVPPPTPRTAPRLDAEAIYRALGGTVLRSPGIYGPDRGLHVRLLRGEYRLPDNGHNTVSRIHVQDLARFILASAGVHGESFVVGDMEPATHERVVRWLCEAYGVAFPASAPSHELHHTLRADRAVDSARARRALGVELEYPSFREGMARRA